LPVVEVPAWRSAAAGRGLVRIRVLADKAYTSRANWAHLKLAVRYEATVTIAAINQWLRALRNTA
jgi:hypothetical protein